MRAVFKHPVPYTLNSIYVRTASKANPTATIGIKSQSSGRLSPLHWLAVEVAGGARNLRGLEDLFIASGLMPGGWYALPGPAAKFDAYGNVSGPFIQKVVRSLLAAGESGSSTSLTLRRKRGRASKTQQYFVVKPGVGDHENLPPGIWEQIGAHRVRPVFNFTQRRPTYRQRFDFYGVAVRTAQQRFYAEFNKAMQSALDTAR
jgi:hypothetical protein